MSDPGDVDAAEGYSLESVIQSEGTPGGITARRPLDVPFTHVPRFAGRAASFVRLAAPPVAMLLLALPSLVLRSLVGIDPYDEGIRLYGAMRVLQGAVPYHHFFACYGPAQFYWPAAWFAVLGEQLWVARAAELLGIGGAVMAMTILLRQASAGGGAILWTLSTLLLPLSVVHLG